MPRIQCGQPTRSPRVGQLGFAADGPEHISIYIICVLIYMYIHIYGDANNTYVPYIYTLYIYIHIDYIYIYIHNHHFNSGSIGTSDLISQALGPPDPLMGAQKTWV